MKKIITTLVTFSLFLFTTPHAFAVSTERTGDPDLTAQLSELATPEMNNLVAVTIADGHTSIAGLGADENTDFEIASLTKTFNAELLRQAIEEDIVTLDTTYGDITGVLNKPISSVTLEELANHTSGLPALPEPQATLSTALWFGANKNPYVLMQDTDVLKRAQYELLLSRGGEYSYSNFGAAVLGHLLALVQDTEYTSLIEERILYPLGMDHTFIMTDENITPESHLGLNADGTQAPAWIFGNFSPAGGLRSTGADMAKYMHHILKVGIPRYVWFSAAEYPTAYFHSGLTGGFNSFLIVDPETQKASFALSDIFGMGDVPESVEPVAVTLFSRL